MKEGQTLQASLTALIAEMRTIAAVAGQCSVEGPADSNSLMAAAEAERASRWADALATLVPSPPEVPRLTQQMQTALDAARAYLADDRHDYPMCRTLLALLVQNSTSPPEAPEPCMDNPEVPIGPNGKCPICYAEPCECQPEAPEPEKALLHCGCEVGQLHKATCPTIFGDPRTVGTAPADASHPHPEAPKKEQVGMIKPHAYVYDVTGTCNVCMRPYDDRIHASQEEGTAPADAAALTQECADWKLAFETSNEHVGKLQADIAALREQIATLEEEREEILLKDRGKTREINILTKEVRGTIARAERAEAALRAYGQHRPESIAKLEAALGTIAMMFCEKRELTGVPHGDQDEFCASCCASTALQAGAALRETTLERQPRETRND